MRLRFAFALAAVAALVPFSLAADPAVPAAAPTAAEAKLFVEGAEARLPGS